MMRALIRMLVSRTTRSHRTDFLIDHVEKFLLIEFGVAFLDLVDSEFQHTPSHGGIDEF